MKRFTPFVLTFFVGRYSWFIFLSSAAIQVCGAEDRGSSSQLTALVEFAGYIRTGSDTRFVLTNSKHLTASGWIALGQAFSGYTLEDFDADQEVLSVRKSEVLFRLPLKKSKVKSAKATEAQIIEKSIIIERDGRIFFSGETIEVSDLRSRLAGIAELHPTQKFRLTVYRPIAGEAVTVGNTVKHIGTAIREMPAELRHRFPFLVLRSSPQE